MFQLPMDVLMMTDEPAVLCRGGTIIFANGAAAEVLGSDCVGKHSRNLFDVQIEQCQSSSFVVNMPINGKQYILRVMKVAGDQLIFFSGLTQAPALFNDAFITSLRAGLMNISMSADMLRERAEAVHDEQSLACLCVLTRSYYSIHRLLNNATAARSIFEGSLPFAPVQVNLSQLCGALADILRGICPETELSTDLGKDITLCADPALIKLLMTNLISNSLLHGKGLTHISLRLLETPGNVVLSVNDDGCGIPQSELHTVFDGYRHTACRALPGGGAGLGLTVACGITALHGGMLILESKEGRGTAVRASLKKGEVPTVTARAPQSDYATARDGLLTALADCLPDELYRDKYLDKKL